MKKILTIWGSLFLALIIMHLVLLGIHSLIPSFDMNSGLAALIEDTPVLLLFYFLNRRFWKQKILFGAYPLSKGFGLLWMIWFYLLLAVAAIAFFHLSAYTILITLIGYTVVGIAEEFTFRGLIFGGLVANGRSLPFAVIVSSLLFGFTHVLNLTRQPLLPTIGQMIMAAAFGVLAAVLYMKSHNLIYPIILHAVNDFTVGLLTAGALNSTLIKSATTTSSSWVGLVGPLLEGLVYAVILVPYILTGKKQLALFKEKLLKI